MDIEEVAARLRGKRRTRPMTAMEARPLQDHDRIRSVVASRWFNAVAASSSKPVRRPQTSPLHRRPHSTWRKNAISGRREVGLSSGSAGSEREPSPSRARKKLYVIPFPRAKLWTPADLAGLSGDREPSDWLIDKGEGHAANKSLPIPAKDTYTQLVNATLRAPALMKPGSTTIPACTAAKNATGADEENINHLSNLAPSYDGHQKTAGESECRADPLVSPGRDSSGASMSYRQVVDDQARFGGGSPRSPPSVCSSLLPGETTKEAIFKARDMKVSSTTKANVTRAATDKAPADRVDRQSTPRPKARTGDRLAPRMPPNTCTVSQCLRSPSASAGTPNKEKRKSCSTASGDSSDYSTDSRSTDSNGEDSHEFDDTAELVEDVPTGFDSWLEDVHGAGRDAFWELFKTDITPQFSRPALALLGRNGIGSSFVDGEPNIKYLPQRPVQLHKHPPPASLTDTTATAKPTCEKTTRGLPSPTGPKSAVAFEVRPATPLADHPASSGRSRHPSTTLFNAKSVDNCRTLSNTNPFASMDRPHSSPSVRSGSLVGVSDAGRVSWRRELLDTKAAAATYESNEVFEEDGKGAKALSVRPQTADGENIVTTRLSVPVLNDPADPAMIANRMTRRPLSPRRDYLMRCAEQQLMPVPVINSALKIDESAIHPNAAVEFAAVIDHGKVEDDARNPSAVGEGRGIYGNQTGGGRGHSERNGSFVLRHYYLGPARIKCLETAITSVPVTLGEVKVVDSGLNETGSAALCRVLLGRAGMLRKLDLSGNRIGKMGAAGLAQLIAQKGCALESLKLDGNKAGDQAITAVLRALQRHQPPISHLGISDNRLTIKTMQECAGPIMTGGLSLASIELGWNHMNQQAVEEFADALAWNKSITKVNLEYNNAGEGVHSIAEALQNHRSLKSLNLTSNQVRWQGAIALGEAVTSSSSLRHLILRDNPIGTAAGLQLGVTLANKPGVPCFIDIKGEYNVTLPEGDWRRAMKKQQKPSQIDPEEKSESVSKVYQAKKPSSTVRSHTEADEQLDWLDLHSNKTWDLRMDRPYDRAVARKVLTTFNFAIGGSLVGTFRAAGEAPRHLVFKRRGALMNSAAPSSGGTGNVACGRAYQTADSTAQSGRGGMSWSGRGKSFKRNAQPGSSGADHPLEGWLREWMERKDRGWDGDAPPIEGLTLAEETQLLLAQLPARGMLKLQFKVGKPIASKLSLVVGGVSSEADPPPSPACAAEQIAHLSAASTELLRVATRVNIATQAETERGHALSPTNEPMGLQRSSIETVDGGFPSLLHLLRSLASPIQMCEMVECISKRIWLNDRQLRGVLGAFSDEPKMSEARCRAFLALLGNIRHNSLVTLASGLSPRLKRLYGIAPPDPEKEAKDEAAREKARLGPVALAAAARARALRIASEKARKDQEIKSGVGAEADVRPSTGIEDDAKREQERWRARLWECGWKEGAFFEDLGDIDALAGCLSSTLRRCGLQDSFTLREATCIGSVVKSSAHFNPFAPTGHYDLDMSMPSDRDIFRAILGLDKVNRAYVGMKGLIDPSQHGNNHLLRNFRLGSGRPIKFGLLSRRARKKLVKKASRKKKVAKKKSAGPDTVTTPAPPSRTRKQRPTSKPERRPEAQPAQLDTKMRGDVPAATPSANKKRRDGGATDSKAASAPSTASGKTKRYPTMPTVSRLSFDFLHYIRPPPEATAASADAFQELLKLLASPMMKASLRVSLLRNLCHVLYLKCEQVVELLLVFPGEDDDEVTRRRLDASTEESGSSYREDAFVAMFSRITDESNIDLCLGLLTDDEILRCEARLGLVALFMPTQPDGDYKLDLRGFEHRQIVTLLLELEREDPSLQLLGMRLNGKFLEEGSTSWAAGVPLRGRFRARAITRHAFKTAKQLAASSSARWKMAQTLGWHGTSPRFYPRTEPATTIDMTLVTASPWEAAKYDPMAERSAPVPVPEDKRPRKRAVVRKTRRRKESTEPLGAGKALRVRRQSFSHLNRVRLGLEEFLIYLGEPSKSPQTMDGSPDDAADPAAASQAQSSFQSPPVIGASINEQGADSCLVHDAVAQGVAGAQKGESGTGRESMDGMHDGGIAARNGDVERSLPRRPLRHWASSADIGMVTDGL